MRPWSVEGSINAPASRSASLNGVMCSARSACISRVLLVRNAIDIEMPMAEPRLRTSVVMAVPLVRSCAGRLVNVTVLSETNTRPMPAP